MSHVLAPILVVLSACCGPALAQTAPAAPPANQPASASPPAAAAAPLSALDAELFYQLLLGEIAVRSGESGAGYSLILDAARKTGDARLYRRAVEMALQNRAGSAALEAAEVWQRAMPDSRDANRFLLQILVSLGRLRDAIAPLRDEIRRTPAGDRAAVISVVPRVFARASDKKAAADTVEQALSTFLQDSPTASAAWTTIGRMRSAAGDPAAAIAAAQRAQDLDPKSEGPVAIALELMDPKVPLAEPIVQRYLEQPGASAEVRLAYARNLADAQRMREAARQLDLIVASAPELPDAWLLRGVLRLQDNDLSGAEQSLQRYIQLATGASRGGDERRRGLTQAYLSLSRIAERRGDLVAAGTWLDRIEDAQEMVAAQNRRASILARQGRIDEARKLLRDLPERNPGDARMKLMAELQLLREHKRLREAHDLIETASKREPQDVELLYEHAMLAEKIGDLERMESLLRRAVEIKPDYHHAYNALGYSLADRNVRLTEARELIVKALSLAPGDPFITDSLGWVEFRLGNKSEALRLLDQAYKSRPDAEIAAHLGEVLWVLGQQDRARAIWREGMLLNAENDTLLETLKRLQVKP